MEQIYFIGGSPCSGKSTVAEILSDTYGLRCFKADDRLESCISRGASMNREMCKKQAARTPEETWMREPLHQCREALLLYEEIIVNTPPETVPLDRTNGAAKPLKWCMITAAMVH